MLDILSGRICPELRGKPEYIDMIGLNYYYNNQWICNSCDFLGWNDDLPDGRCKPLSELVAEVYQRYDLPIVFTETSHPKEDRPVWIDMIAKECSVILSEGIPLFGVCIYPIIDRPDWNDLITWHHAGLWDIISNRNDRILYQPMADALLKAQKQLKPFLSQASVITIDQYA